MRYLVLLALLAGCATQKPVEIPVTVLCKTPTIDRPDFYFSHATKDMDIFDVMKLLLADRRQRMGYETELEAAVKVCQ